VEFWIGVSNPTEDENVGNYYPVVLNTANASIVFSDRG
jgi:hypothetical protein